MTQSSLHPDQLEVEAELYFKQEDGNPSLRTAQLNLLDVMQRRRFAPVHKGERVWEFILNRPRTDPGLLWKLKKKIGKVNEIDREAEQTLEHLRGTRDNHPYRFKFRFIPLVWDSGEEGYRIEVECLSALREKIDQLHGSFEDRSSEGVVRTCKSELRDIATEVGFGILTEPFTPRENYQSTLTTHLRTELQQPKYGQQIVQFADEADEALRYSLTRPALSAYFHGIEWAIITHLNKVNNHDIIEEEGYEPGWGFPKLVQELKETGNVKQVTSEALDSMNTERIWMAHHKEGKVSDIEVRRVKQRFAILLEELFL